GPSGATTIFPLYVSRLAGGRAQPLGAAAALSLAPVLLPLIVILGRGLRGNERTLDRPPRAWSGAAWALVWLARLPLLALDTIADAIARAFGATWRGVRTGDPRGNATSVSRGRLASAGANLALGALLAFALGPFYWIVVTALKSNQQITGQRSPFWPDPWTTFQFSYVLTATDFLRWFANTIRVAGLSCAVAVLVGTLGAYALARLRFRGAGWLATAILGTALVPSVLFLIPLYLLLSQLRLFNTPGALLVAYPTFGLPMACWLMLGFFRALPEELEEAALIDGCTRWQAFLRIVLPLSRPALLAVTLFTLTAAWNELLFASIFVRSEALWTLPRGLSAMATGDIFPYGRMFAASLLMALPVTVLAAIGQRAMVSGLTAGAVKG
ncbi:MAG TPA: carbohydrate ABC transporter permease, partial [Thermomicrobiales bacterium]